MASKSFIDWLVNLCMTWTTPYFDRQLQTICVLKGNLTFRRQSHYDIKQSKWVFTEEIVVVTYMLQTNNIGDRAFEIRSEKAIPDHLVKMSDEYIQIVEPWIQGTLTIQDLKAIFAEYPERMIFPFTGVVDLPTLKAPTSVSVETNHTLITDQSDKNGVDRFLTPRVTVKAI